MDDAVIAKHLENIDHRVDDVLQILQHNINPRLEGVESRLTGVESRLTGVESRLTGVESRLTNVEQILPTLATKDDLKGYATKEDLRAEHDRLRLDVQILLEHQDSKLQIIAEHVLSLMPKPREQ